MISMKVGSGDFTWDGGWEQDGEGLQLQLLQKQQQQQIPEYLAPAVEPSDGLHRH